jgi:O-antigen/teichoic acid export membrane protein
MLINLATGNVTVVLLMGGKSSWNVVNTLAALIVNVGLNIVLLPRIGILGAAIAWAASILVDNVAAVIEVWLTLGLGPFGPGYLTVIAAAGGGFTVAGLAARHFIGQTLAGLVAAALAGLIVCAATAYAGRRRLQLVGLRSVFASGKGRTPAAAGRHRADAGTASPARLHRGGRPELGLTAVHPSHRRPGRRSA